MITPSAFCEERGAVIVSRMTSTVRGLENYAVRFSVSGMGFESSGEYHVSGDAYSLVLGDVGVWCDGSVRWEVNNTSREITIDAVDRTERNILNNPVSGLEFVGEEYDASLLSEDGAESVVRLTQRGRDGRDRMVVDVAVDSRTWLPRRVVYRMGSDSITIILRDIKRSSHAVERFDASIYPGYEVIDFR